MTHKPFVLGITGGIGAGKSAVTEAFVALGAVRLDADRACHRVLETAEFKRLAFERWGRTVFSPNNSSSGDEIVRNIEENISSFDNNDDFWGNIDVNRSALADIVFAETAESASERKYLERLTHPKIALLFESEIAACSASGTRFFVLDAPLLFESGWDRFCTRTLFVDAPEEIRFERTERRRWSRREFERREKTQMPPEEKRARADFVVDNSGVWSETVRLIDRIWADLQQTSIKK